MRKQLIPFKPNGEKSLKTNPDQNSGPKILRFASLPGQNELHIGRVATSTTSNPASAIDQSLDKIASSRKRTRESLENSAGRISVRHEKSDFQHLGTKSNCANWYSNALLLLNHV